MAVRHADAGLDYFGASSMIAGWVGWLCQVSLGEIGSGGGGFGGFGCDQGVDRYCAPTVNFGQKRLW